MNQQERILAADGIHNFRDYGGYRAMGGARIKSGLLFRSGQHKDASAADLELVVDRDIRTIIDLRGDAERASFPCPRHPAFRGTVVFVAGETVNPALDAQELDSADAAASRMRNSYSNMPFRPLLKDAFIRYFAVLLDEAEGASLVHCLAGKDRTGLAVALFHHLLGVHPDDLMADYLLTNEAGRIEARIEAGAAVIRDRYGLEIPLAAIRKLMSADPAFLEAAFQAIIERFGTIDTYLERGLGVSPTMRGALAEKYLA